MVVWFFVIELGIDIVFEGYMDNTGLEKLNDKLVEWWVNVVKVVLV